MADLKNGLNSPLFGVFLSGSLHRKTLMFLKNDVSQVFGIFSILPKLTILQKLYIAFAWAIAFAEVADF